MQGNAVYESDSHRVVLRADGLLLVYARAARVLIERAIDLTTGQVIERLITSGDGTAAGDLLANMDRLPIFATTCDRKDHAIWHVDADAGFQRWTGDQPEPEIVWALTQCGFEDTDIGAMVDYCHEHTWDYCPRQG